MSTLETDRTTLNTPAQHVADHNEIHRLHNIFESSQPAFLSNDTPEHSSAAGSPGFSTEASRADHQHPSEFRPAATVRPTSAVAETYDRVLIDTAAHNLGASGFVPVYAMPVKAGAVLTQLHFKVSATTTGQTHLWMVLFDSALAGQRVTNDLGASTPAANGQVDLTLTTPLTIGAADTYLYAGICWVYSGTTPSCFGKSTAGRNAVEILPRLFGNVSTGETGPHALPWDVSGTYASWSVTSDYAYIWAT